MTSPYHSNAGHWEPMPPDIVAREVGRRRDHVAAVAAVPRVRAAVLEGVTVFDLARLGDDGRQRLRCLLDGRECARCPGGGRRWVRETDGSYGGTLQDCGCREVRRCPTD